MPGCAPAVAMPRACPQGHRIPRRAVRLSGQPGAVYDHLDFVLRAGKSVAIVGANGAGKTTLVKLLCGLLDVDDGRIEVDDVRSRSSIARRGRDAWPRSSRISSGTRSALATTSRWAAGAARGARSSSRRRRWRAASSGSSRTASPRRSPETSAASMCRAGSGGEFALARAMYAVERGASVLILDEPTAHLDIRAEAELFDRFLELTRGLTTILISHRFSSVRHAQRIVVLDGGRIVEDRVARRTFARDGLYARMFASRLATSMTTMRETLRTLRAILQTALAVVRAQRSACS